MPNKLIIAGLSSRAYVESAVSAGYEVIALDAFADADTREMTVQTWQLPVFHDGFEASEILATLDRLPLGECEGFCYGAGFEGQPELLDEIAARIRVFGNRAEAVRLSKSPEYFCSLCDRFSMLYPPMTVSRPLQTDGWLYKQVGGAGGAHVVWADRECTGRGYYQQHIAGAAISCLFAAHHGEVHVIGFNEQWCSPSEQTPFRYGGAVSQAVLPEDAKTSMTRFVGNVARELDLQGVNSADFIWDGENLYALEINPRLSATLDLYRAANGRLFDCHLVSASGLKLDEIARAHYVVYAENPVEIGTDWDWPAWVSDIPSPNSRIAAGLPICTLKAEAGDVQQAKQLVLARYQVLQDWLNQTTTN
jgi:uncharacterized protein